MAFILKRCELFSNGTSVYLAGEDNELFIETLLDKYKGSHYKDARGILVKLKTFKIKKINENDFRTIFIDGKETIKHEGGKDITALFYESLNEHDNLFRIYCIWPVFTVQRIIIIGGGGIKDKDGPFQQIPELLKYNGRLVEIETLLRNGFNSGKISVTENRLVGGLDNLKITN